MPTYDFRCPEGHEFSRFFRKISDAVAELPCPECGAVAERRISAGAGLAFKGTGFYLTDYGKNAHRKSAPAPSKGEGKSETKSETKPEGSAAAKPADSKPSSGGSGGGTGGSAT
jgi:putative FmdB family regulatory protein